MKKTKLNLYSDISGNNIDINLYHYGKGACGLYVQGGVHGGELTYFVFERLHEWLIRNENSLTKKITLAPIVNPPAWNQRVYYYTVGKFDLYKGKDWNRSYPGEQTTLSARNSQKISNFIQSYKFALDLHTARTSAPYLIFMDKRMVPYVQAFGLKYNVFLDKNKAENSYKGTFDYALLDKKTLSMTCECGSHDEYNVQNVDTVVKSILNLIYKLNIYKKTGIIKATKQIVVKRVDTIFTPISGFTRYHLIPHASFIAGDVLATITHASDISKTTKIKASSDGVMFELARSHISWIGDELMRVSYNKDLASLSSFQE